MNEAEYNRLLRPYSRALSEVMLNFNYFIEDIGQLNVFSVSHRLKSYKNAVAKSNSLKIPIQELQDLAGLRIVVATTNEVEVVCRFFTRQEYSKDIKIESDKYISKKDGYRARHIIFVYGGSYNRSMYPSKIEAQIQTIFEHAFNFISRAWVYKSNKSYSPDWETKFLELSEYLSSINYQANQLHTAVIKSSSNIESDEPLSPYSYQQIVKQIFNENISLADAVDSCRYHVDIGYTTNKLMKEFYENENIKELREEFVELNKKENDNFSKSILDMSLYSFYEIFGVRYKATKEMLEKIKYTYENKIK